jgi:hypothetical protein
LSIARRSSAIAVSAHARMSSRLHQATSIALVHRPSGLHIEARRS